MKINISSLKIVNVVMNIIFTVFFFFLYHLNAEGDISKIALIGILQYVWMISSWYVATRNLMNIYLFFLVLSFFFYLGQPVLYLFNVDMFTGMSITNSPFSEYQIKTTLIFILKGMALFHLGSSFSLKNIQRSPAPIESTINMRAVELVGLSLFVISVVPQLSATFENLKATLVGGYYTIFQTDFALGAGLNGGLPRFLAGFFKASLLLLIIGNKDNPKKLKFWLWFASIFSVLMLASGQRGSNVLFIVGLILLYHYAIKPFTKKQIFTFGILAVVGVVALSGISTVRNIGISNYSFGELMNMLSGRNFFIDLMKETGFTLIACTTVMVYSPSVIPFNDGATYFNSLYSLIPNLFWEVNPSAIGGVDAVFKSKLTDGSGIGSSFIIEAYYNFGMYGLLLMPLFGFLIGKLHISMARASQDKNYLKLYMCVYLSSVVLWYVRSETLAFWRDFGYLALLPVLLIVAFTAFDRKMSKVIVRNRLLN